MKVEIPDKLVRATRAALYHQWNRITDDNGIAITCTQEMADATYDALQIFEQLVKDMAYNQPAPFVQEHVKTNIGVIPLEDYYDIRARQLGFEDYEDLKSQGYSLDKPETIVLDENNEEVENDMDLTK